MSGEEVDSTAISAPPSTPADPYRAYVQTLYADVVEDLRRSVFSTETISLRAVESAGDVAARPARRLTPKYIPYALRDDDPPTPAPVTGAPAEFDSLRDAYLSTGCDGRVLLLGEPGAGKTTSLLAFARDAAAARLDDPRQPLPVFARISGWNSNPPTPLTEWLATQHDGLQPDALASLIEHGDALLLLDGLDELGNRRPIDPDKPEKGDYDPRERFLAILPPSGRLILSSRVEDYRQIGQQARLNCAVRLQGLDDAQMQAYLSNAPDLWEIVSGDADLKEALRTPLLLALFRVGFESSPEEARKLKDLNEVDLNTHIWNVFIERRWKFEQARSTEPLPYTIEEVKDELVRGTASAFSKSIRTSKTLVARSDFSSRERKSFIELAQQLDLLQPAGTIWLRLAPPSRERDRVSAYRFLHLRLRDALLFAGLRHADAIVRAKAFATFGYLRDPRAIEPSIAALRDPEGIVRRDAAHALGKIKDARAVETLIVALRDSENDVRCAAAHALGEIKDRRAVEVLIAALHDTEGIVRAAAATALGNFTNVQVLDPLIAALRDPDTEVRRFAVDALGATGDNQAVKPLIAMLRDPSFNSIPYAAVAALRKFPNNQLAQAALAEFVAGRIKPRNERSLWWRLIGWRFDRLTRRRP